MLVFDVPEVPRIGLEDIQRALDEDAAEYARRWLLRA
jgi:hypothetical protein